MLKDAFLYEGELYAVTSIGEMFRLTVGKHLAPREWIWQELRPEHAARLNEEILSLRGGRVRPFNG